MWTIIWEMLRSRWVRALSLPPDQLPTDVFFTDDSPYPEVRSAVANFDDPTMPASTFRAWVLSIFWAIVLPGMNQFFHLRNPSVTIGGVSLHTVSNYFADFHHKSS